MPIKNFSMLLFLSALLSTITVPKTFGQDLDNDIQGDATTVTRYNLCVEEKLKTFNPIAGTIPLVSGSLAATDLLCDSDECGWGVQKGDVLTPFQATQYFEKRFKETRCQWTLADLDPKEDPSIWEDKIGGDIVSGQDQLAVEDLDKVQFVSTAWGRLGSYRVTVNKDNAYGVPTQYSMILSKTAHNYILRKSLLRKLGYKIPAVKWVKRVKVQFDNKKQMDEFVSALSINNAGSFDRWVLNKTKDNEVILQDILLMEDQEFDLNLAKGYVSPDIAQGKRIYDSLLIPFALVEVPESVNMFDWTYGREYSGNLVVKYPLSRDFQTSYGDALWMARRIAKLTENDWWDIVESTSLPPSVKLLVYHKLMSRRNHLLELMGIEAIEFRPDTMISNQDDLVEGEIVKEFYDGYARRFKIPDPESPIDSRNMRAFFKSKAFTLGLKTMGDVLNSQKFMGTDIAGRVDQEVERIMAENVSESMVTENVTKTPVASFIFPTVKGNVILNREIIAGAYMGTDNRLQLVDTIGGSVSAGVFGGITGIYSKTGKKVNIAGDLVRQQVPVNLNANANVSISRTYSHIRPIKSIQQGLKYKFKNVFVPKIMKKHGNVVNELLSDEMQREYDQNPQDATTKMIELLNKHIEIGESVIITDSIGAEVGMFAGASLYQIVDVKVGAKGKRFVLSRLHILRKSEDEFHIYKSLGNVKALELSVGVEKFIPITKVIVKFTSGKARTKYYRVKVGAYDIDGEQNYNRIDKVKALASVFSSGATSAMDTVQRPYVLTHNFGENTTKFGILVWRWNWLNQNHEISVTSPDGKKIDFYRRLEGKSSGRDYENYAKDVISGVADELLDANFGFRSFNSGNPGFTFHGQASNLVASYESIKTEDGRLVKPMFKLSRIYNGWKMGKEKLMRRLRKIKKRYNYEFFKPESLAQTKDLFLYNINVNFFVHTSGIDYLLNLSDEKIKRIWRNFTRFPENEDETTGESGADFLISKISAYKRQNEKLNYKKVGKYAVDLIKIIEENLYAHGIVSMFGGGRNVLAVGKIDGYRVGDENGDQSIISNSVGREGSEGIEGPLGSIRKFLGMTNGEFYINWLLGRVI